MDQGQDETYGVGDNDDNDSAVESILAEALASGDAVQICRTPKRRSSGSELNGVDQAKLAIMSLFGQQEETSASEAGIIAEPASLQNMRRAARANRALAAGKNSSSSGGRRRGNLRRSHTVGDPVGTPYDRRAFLKGGAVATLAPATPAAAATATSTENTSPAQGRRTRRPMARSKTSDTPPRSLSPAPTPTALNRHATTMSHYYMMDDNSQNNRHHHHHHHPTSHDMGQHEETVQRLKVHDDDIQQILQDPKAFAKLQKVLRKHGAVTNEVLRQVLPLYVKHHHAEKEKEAKKEKEKQQQQQEQMDDEKKESAEEATAKDASTPPTPVVATPSSGWFRTPERL